MTEAAPALVSGGLAYDDIDVGGFHTCGVTTPGDAHRWGRKTFGQVGDATLTSRHTPTRVVQ